MSKPIKNNSKLLYLQARQLFERAQEKFDDGTIKTEPKLVDAVFTAFQEFFTSMGKPNMVPRYAPEQGPPWSEDYNSMMREIMQDLELLFQELDILGRSLYADFNHNMVQQETINKQFEIVLDKMRDLETYAGFNASGVEIGRDDFLNKDKIDYERIAGTPLEIIDGAVTLPQVSRTNVAENARVTIVTGNRKKDGFIIGTESNGFPGNNTEIHSTTDEILTNQNYIPTFIGEENNHSSYSHVLDGSPNTWFEYEKVSVREHDKIRVAKNIGWDYQVHESQTVEWIGDPENGILKLHMQIFLEKEEVINQINCNMYTPPHYGAQTAVVKNILVSDGKSAPRSVLPKKRERDQYSFHFPPVRARVVSVIFEQPHKYITDIGHIFYEKKMQVDDSVEYAMDAATKKKTYSPRVEGPLISLEDLGIEVNVSDTNVEAKYPLTDIHTERNTSIGETINRLMNNLDSDAADMGIERFEGFRWCIGVRDIEVFSCEYAPEGELVTHPFYFDKPIDKISIEVNETIPNMFMENDSMRYDWLHYYVSIDDGATWHPITPLRHDMTSESSPPKIYTVRTVETSEQFLDGKDSYLESEYPVYSLRMKIVGKRIDNAGATPFAFRAASNSLEDSDSDASQASPIINSYMFHIESVPDPLDSEESDRIAIDESNIGSKPDTGFDPDEPPTTGEGGGPWDDDDGDGIPNWKDPDHPEYIPDPPDGWEPPGKPGGGDDPWDDNGNGIPNENDPNWKPQNMHMWMDNKKREWCYDTDLRISGHVFTNNSPAKITLTINGVTIGEQSVTVNSHISNERNFEFTIPAKTYNPLDVLTIVIKAEDGKEVLYDTVVTNIIDCEDLPPSERPDNQDKDELTVVIDNKTNELCVCDSLIFYGTAQGPNPIRSLVFRVNGRVIDPNALGAPPENDPCVTGARERSIEPLQNQVSTVSIQSVPKEKLTDEELLQIEDFGEWLEAFEEREDCGCKNKKKKRQQSTVMAFQQQATPFASQASSNEESFYVNVPYWKLRELGVTQGSRVQVEVTAIDSINNDEVDSFEFIVKDCDKPEVDDNGNPRVRDCYQLESVEVHYYDYNRGDIRIENIPHNALPYEGVSNGAGSGIVVGWNKRFNAPVIMQTSGYDDSGYTFQIHAVGVHYFDEYDQPHTFWTKDVVEKTATVRNPNKMIGEPNRSTSWIEDMRNGDYSTAPGFGRINDHATFVMDNDWAQNACNLDVEDFRPEDYEAPPEPDEEDCEETEDCNEITHVVFQLYDESGKNLKVYKIDISDDGKDSYELRTKNGTATIVVGWSAYFNGPTMQIQSASGDDNILLTAMGVVYKNKCGEAVTAWSSGLRYRTNGVQYPEFAIGDKKGLSHIDWIEHGAVNYDEATYIGRQGDMIAFTLEEELTDELCETESIDDEIGIDPNNPPDMPMINFSNVPDVICYEDESFIISATATDSMGLRYVHYGMLVNGIDVIGPYEDEVSGLQYTVDFPMSLANLQVGDTVRLHVKAINIFGIELVKTIDLVVESCDTEPPEIDANIDMSKEDGNYCYSDLIDGNKVPINLFITDDMALYEWSISHQGRVVESQEYDMAERVTATGEEVYEILITLPAKVDDGRGANNLYYPDETYTFVIKARDHSGKTAEETITLTLTDCEYEPIPVAPCGETTEGGNGPAIHYHHLGETAGKVTISYDFYGAVDNMDVYYGNTLLHRTGNVTYQGSFTIDYQPVAGDYRIKVVMNDGQSGSQWTYTVSCPTPEEPPISHAYDYKVRMKWGYTAEGSDLDLHAYDRKNGQEVYYSSKTYEAPDGSKIWLDHDYSSGHKTAADILAQPEIVTIEGYRGETISIGVVDWNGKYNLLNKGTLPAKAIIEILTEQNTLIKTINIPDDAFDIKGEDGKGAYYVCDINIPSSGTLSSSNIVEKGIKGQLN